MWAHRAATGCTMGRLASMARALAFQREQREQRGEVGETGIPGCQHHAAGGPQPHPGQNGVSYTNVADRNPLTKIKDSGSASPGRLPRRIRAEMPSTTEAPGWDAVTSSPPTLSAP